MRQWWGSLGRVLSNVTLSLWRWWKWDAFIVCWEVNLNYLPDNFKSNSDIAQWQRDRLDEKLISQMRFNCPLIVPGRKETTWQESCSNSRTRPYEEQWHASRGVKRREILIALTLFSLDLPVRRRLQSLSRTPIDLGKRIIPFSGENRIWLVPNVPPYFPVGWEKAREREREGERFRVSEWVSEREGEQRERERERER